MSDAVTALKGRRHEGRQAAVAEAPLQGMVTLRGALNDPGLAAALTAATGLALPARREILRDGDRAIAWMSPDELLLLVPYESTAELVADLGGRLSGIHHLAVDVSDARAVFHIEGPGTREVLARLCPADLSPAALPAGEVRRTRLGQVAAAFWFDEADAATLVCFRSVARYAFDLLAQATDSPPVDFLAHPEV